MITSDAALSTSTFPAQGVGRGHKSQIPLLPPSLDAMLPSKSTGFSLTCGDSSAADGTYTSNGE